MSCEKIKIVLAGRQQLLKSGIRAAVAPHPNMEVVDEVDHHSSTTELVRQLKPNVIIIDGLLPNCTKRECAARISMVSFAKVIILSEIPSFDCACRMFDLGAAGYLLKNCDLEEVPAAVQAVYEEKLYISHQIAQQSRMLQLAASQNKQTKKLTPREREVLCLITAGYTIKQIAGCMGIKSVTIMTFKKRIRDKLYVNNDVDLTKFAINNGFASLNL